jgi:hypothetical protein
MSQTKMLSLFICIILVGLVVGILAIQKSNEYFNSGGTPYARLGGSYNPQLFSPCEAKRCAGGPYMYSSNPYLQALCQGVTNSELAQMSCGKGFHGRPVHFSYSGLSESVPTRDCGKNLKYGAWDNALCNGPTPTSLCVL